MDNLSSRQEIAALEARVKALENIVVSNGLPLLPSTNSSDDRRKRPRSISSQQESSHPTQKHARTGSVDVDWQAFLRENRFEKAESLSEEDDDEHSGVRNAKKVTEVCC